MANDVKQSPDFQGSLGNLMPLMGTYDGSFRLLDTYGLTGTQQPQSVSWSLPESLNPQAISPGLLRNDRRASIDRTCLPMCRMSRFTLLTCLTGGTWASPLRSVSGYGNSDSGSEYDYPASAAGRSVKSDVDGRFALLDGDLDSSSSNEGRGPSPGKKPHRKLKWSSGSDMKRYEREAKEREVEKQKEMAGFELGPTKGNKREKRRMQNRLAQRAFRARCKIQNKEVGSAQRCGYTSAPVRCAED